MPALKDRFQSEVAPALASKLGLKNVLAVPTLEKIVVTLGFGAFREDKNFIDEVSRELSMICGQKPALRTAKKAISGFKLRKGDKVGFMATLRGRRMWDFFEKLVGVVLPRLRDFQGVSRDGFDGHGSYTLGIREHVVFPEIDPNKVTRIKGLKVTIVTTAKSDEEGRMLLGELGMPFEK